MHGEVADVGRAVAVGGAGSSASCGAGTGLELRA